MTKGELIEIIAQRSDFNLKRAELVVNTVFGAMSGALEDGDRVEIRGFGSFCIRDRKSIRARNPKTGESIELPKRSMPYFRASKLLKQRIN